MNLLAADLRALANLPTTRPGRRLLFGTGVGFALLATLSWWFATTLLHHPSLLAQLHRRTGGDEQRALLGYGLLACPLVASWLGLALAQRQLFETPELALWRQAPLPSWRGPLQVLLRATFLASCWSCTLALPVITAVLSRAAAPPWALALAPLAVVGATMPLLAALLAMHLVLVRFFAGRTLRAVFGVLGALASVGFSTWLLSTMFGRGGANAQDVLAIAHEPDRLPPTVAPGADLLAAAARGQLDGRALVAIGCWLVGTLAAFRLVARLHPVAWERWVAAAPRHGRRRGRSWPSAIAATVRNKEIAQLLQQPGALVGFLVFAVLVFALCRQQALVGGLLADRQLPRDVVHFGVLLVQWFLAVLLVLYAHMGRLVAWDGAQWSLWVVSPARPFAILRGKLVAIFLFLLWPLLLVAACGHLLLDVERATLVVFAATAIGGTLVAIGAMAAIGTLPLLVRPDESGQVVPGSRGLLGSLALVICFQLLLSPAVVAWQELTRFASRRHLSEATAWSHAWTVVAIALAYGLVVAAIGAAIGTRNYRVLLRPR